MVKYDEIYGTVFECFFLEVEGSGQKWTRSATTLTSIRTGTIQTCLSGYYGG